MFFRSVELESIPKDLDGPTLVGGNLALKNACEVVVIETILSVHVREFHLQFPEVLRREWIIAVARVGVPNPGRRLETFFFGCPRGMLIVGSRRDGAGPGPDRRDRRLRLLANAGEQFAQISRPRQFDHFGSAEVKAVNARRKGRHQMEAVLGGCGVTVGVCCFCGFHVSLYLGRFVLGLCAL